MLKQFVNLGLVFSLPLLAISCQEDHVTEVNEDARVVHVDRISDDMAKVRDYVPYMAVMAHRGSTFWTPEETESAYRWAREMGADYLEADLQCTKDGVVLALHDDNLSRTTNIQAVYGEDVPSTRKQFYMNHGMSEAAAEAQVKKDKEGFVPYYAKAYMYEELMKLDAGTWFNNSTPNQARRGFSEHHQYISALSDMIAYAEGKMLARDTNGERIYTITGTYDPDNALDCLDYTFQYVADPQDTGNRPGIYIEFKESWLNPGDFEQRVYDELDKWNWNIMTKPEPESNAHYVNGKVNVGNTNGKVILQTFSLQSLIRTAGVFKGQLPMCFLFWTGNGATDLKYNTPQGYADFINLGLQYKAHIIGPSIAGAPNNYPEMNEPWQDYLIERAGMLNHPYSFDSHDQMAKYFGEYNYGVTDPDLFNPPYMDGLFTNRSEMTLQYLIDKGVRKAPAPQTVPDPNEVLDRLGYTK